MTKGVWKSRFQVELETLTISLMCNMIKKLWRTGKTAIMGSGLYVLKGFVGIVEVGIYGSVLVNNFRSYKTYIYRY